MDHSRGLIRPMGNRNLTALRHYSSTSIGAYLASIKKQQEHMKLMCEPFLNMEITLDPNKKIYSYSIQNKGIGPAIITGVYFSVDNKKIQSKNIIHDFVQETFKGIEFETFNYSALHPGNYLSVNESRILFQINTQEKYPQ